MDRLILLRHGEAVRRAPSGRDFDRALTAAGRAGAAGAGHALAAKGFAPDLVLVSTAVRAQQTWAVVAGNWPGAPACDEARLYNAPAGAIFDLAAARSAAAVMVVAHNPGLHDLAAGLGGDEAFVEGLPPAGAAVLVRGAPGWSLAFAHVPPNPSEGAR